MLTSEKNEHLQGVPPEVLEVRLELTCCLLLLPALGELVQTRSLDQVALRCLFYGLDRAYL